MNSVEIKSNEELSKKLNEVLLISKDTEVLTVHEDMKKVRGGKHRLSS